MIRKRFIITQNLGKKFSTKSGDNNKIHINNDYAYNSIFGKKICFGSQILIESLKLLNISFKDNFSLKVSFNQPAFYEIPINIIINKKKDSNQLIEIFQLNRFLGNIEINKKQLLSQNYFEEKLKYTKQNKKILNKKISFKKINPKSSDREKLNYLLMRLSKYVGVYFPGENSLILEIEIFYNKNLNFRKFEIESSEYDKRFKLIKNTLKFEKFLILFKSLVRPKFDKNKNYIYSKKIKEIVKNLKDNILIIGASQGLGLQFLKIFKMNKKINLYATYNKNKISINDTNVSKIKVDIKKDLKKIYKIIAKSRTLKIFYFVSEKIYFEKKLDNQIKKNYKHLFLEFPIKIINRILNNKKIQFFYPSTINIEIDKNSYYSKIKLLAEKKIHKLKKKSKAKILTHRFPAIYSKQSINLVNREPISLSRYLDRNSNLLKLIVNKN